MGCNFSDHAQCMRQVYAYVPYMVTACMFLSPIIRE